MPIHNRISFKAFKTISLIKKISFSPSLFFLHFLLNILFLYALKLNCTTSDPLVFSKVTEVRRGTAGQLSNDF